MQLLTDSKTMRAMDAHTIRELGVPSLVLMQRAAAAVCEEIEGHFLQMPFVFVFCGGGNNGADGLAAALILTLHGADVKVFLCPAKHRTPEWEALYEGCRRHGIEFADAPADLTKEPRKPGVIIDAMFGIGLSRPLSEEFQEIVRYINGADAWIVSVDIPSGISADTGAVLGDAVQADCTVTFEYSKKGLALYPGRAHAGRVAVRGIGIDDSVYRARSPKTYTLEAADLDLLPERPEDAHKGTFGRLLVIAGSRGMCGASYLAGLAAYRSGAGLVQILAPEENRVILQELLPEAVLTLYDPEHFDPAMLPELFSAADAAVIGPGLGVTQFTETVLYHVLFQETLPCVLDADALNTLAEHPEWLEGLREGLVLTPHLKEFSRLTALPVPEIAEKLPVMAEAFSRVSKAVLVLKNAATLVSAAGEDLFINTLGNSGMATGGSGDVLSGVIGALLAGGLPPAKAAVFGVLMHAAAGDRAREIRGERAMLARDIADQIR